MTGTHPEEQPKQPNRVNLTAIIAGALASLSAAVVASYFGVAGTLIGTAVVSIVSSLGAAVYAGVIGRTQGLVQRTTTVLHVLPERTGDRQSTASEEGPGGQEPSGASGDRDSSGDGEAAAGRRAGGATVSWPWRRSAVVVGVAVLIFVIAIGAVTGIEALIKEPLASALGVRDRGQARTSVGVAVHRAGGSVTTRPPGPSSSTPPSTGQPGQAPPTTQPAPSTTTGGTAPPSTAPPTTAQPPPSSTTGGTSSSH